MVENYLTSRFEMTLVMANGKKFDLGPVQEVRLHTAGGLIELDYRPDGSGGSRRGFLSPSTWATFEVFERWT